MKQAIKSFLKRTIKYIFKQAQLTQILNELNMELQLDLLRSSCSTDNTVRFSSTTKIWNLQHKPSQIIIQKNSIIDGQLQVLEYGGKIVIGENSYIGHSSQVWSGESVCIGNNVLIAHNVSITDTNAHELDSKERTERHKDFLKGIFWDTKGSIETAPVKIEDNAWVNFNVVILKGVTIGEGSIVAAGSVVTKNVTPYTMVAGVPARFVKNIR